MRWSAKWPWRRSRARMASRMLVLALLGLVTTSLPATTTVEQNGAQFPTAIRLDDHTLSLSGTGVARYRVIFTVYAAALYTPPDTARDKVLDPAVPRRLEIEYFHEISADDIIRAANTKLADQLSPERLAALEPKITRFHGLFQAVSDGDRYRMDYLPGVGTRLSFNGEPVGAVSGGDFAAAYFGIWLDPGDPLSDRLREDLLTGTR